MASAYPVLTDLIKPAGGSAAPAMLGVLTQVDADPITVSAASRAPAFLVDADSIGRTVVTARTAVVLVGDQVHLTSIRGILVAVPVVLDTGETADPVKAGCVRVRMSGTDIPAQPAVLGIGFNELATHAGAHDTSGICAGNHLILGNRCVVRMHGGFRVFTKRKQ
jgi:hypothetical protein